MDEIFGINNGYVHLHPSMLPLKEGQPPPTPSKSGTGVRERDRIEERIMLKIFSLLFTHISSHSLSSSVPTPMNSNDVLYNNIRDSNFAVIPQFLSKKTQVSVDGMG